jgi:hypothetical protein
MNRSLLLSLLALCLLFVVTGCGWEDYCDQRGEDDCSACSRAATSAEDESEASVESQCSDGIDNDADGLTDFPLDPECTSAQDEDEFLAGVQYISDLDLACSAGGLNNWINPTSIFYDPAGQGDEGDCRLRGTSLDGHPTGHPAYYYDRGWGRNGCENDSPESRPPAGGGFTCGWCPLL